MSSGETPAEKVERFQTALDQFLTRIGGDRHVLAVVLVGSLSEATIWRRESLCVWIIETDGVSRRLRSDGNEERLFRILVEQGINIHAEVMPRTRFKQMVEGTARTAFSHNFFAKRMLVFCQDASIEAWFERANELAIKDQERDLLIYSSWTIHAHRHATRRLEAGGDLHLAGQEVLWGAHSVAHTEIIRQGEVWEGEVIHRAIEGDRKLFQTIYLDVLDRPADRDVLIRALQEIENYLDRHSLHHLRPVLDYLRKTRRVVPLSEIGDHFAYSQLHPWHLESACEWLERKGRLEKLSAPFKLTKRSRDEVEEPAYLLLSDS